MKYTVIHPFSPHDFFMSSYDEYGDEKYEDFENDMEWLIYYVGKFYDSITEDTEDYLVRILWKYVSTHKQFRNHLIKYGFIKEVQEEMFYKIGQRFRYKMGGSPFDGLLYHLNQCGKDKVCLNCLSSGEMWTFPITVKDVHKITQDEFKTISIESMERFKLIECGGNK